MQRDRSTTIGQGKEVRTANPPRMTGYEILQCDGCGHEYVRPAARPNVLPCGKCGNRDWQARPLLAGAPRIVGANV